MSVKGYMLVLLVDLLSALLLVVANEIVIWKS